MKQLRKDIKAIVLSQSKNYRIEDGDNPDSFRVFVDNDQVERIGGLLKMYIPPNIHIEVSPINDEPEVKSEKPSPLELVAELLNVPMVKQDEDGDTVYLEEIKLSRKIGAAKYTNRKPNKDGGLLAGVIEMLGNIIDSDDKPTPGCDCKRCEALRELFKVPSDDKVH